MQIFNDLTANHAMNVTLAPLLRSANAAVRTRAVRFTVPFSGSD